MRLRFDVRDFEKIGIKSQFKDYRKRQKNTEILRFIGAVNFYCQAGKIFCCKFVMRQ